VVYGLGGIGGYFGGRLCELAKSQKNIRVVFVVTQNTFSVVKKKGKIILDTFHGRVVIDNPEVIQSESTQDLGPVDYVILTTKTYHIPNLVESIKPLVGRNTLIIPLQNGMETTTYLCKELGRERAHNVGCGSCKINSFIVEVGHIKSDTKTPILYFGEIDNKRSDRVLKLLDLFKQCTGIKAEVPKDIHWILWEKFILIVALSGVGSVTRATIGQWVLIEETKLLFDQCVVEGINVSKAFGITMGEGYREEVNKRAQSIGKESPKSTTSMQRDIMSNQQSEMENLVGSMVRLGKQKGVHTPTLDFIYAALKPLALVNSQKSKL